MKYNYSIFSLTLIFVSSLIAMEETATPDHLVSLVNSIDEAINQKYSSPFLEQYTPNFLQEHLKTFLLSEESINNIVSLVYQHCTDQQAVAVLCSQLYEKNKYFSTVINFFTQKVRSPIDNITSDTIDTAESLLSSQLQFTPQELPILLQHWIVSLALTQTNCCYTIRLTGHTDEIISFDIYIPKKHIITTGKDNTVRLWNLDDGTCIATLQGNDKASRVCFNKKGSHIITVTNNYEHNTCILRQWRIDQPNFLQTHEYQLNTPINYISYYSKRCLLGITPIVKEIDPVGIREYCALHITLKKDQTLKLKSTRLFGVNIFYHGDDRLEKFNFENYQAKIEQNDLVVTKNNCHDVYLCKRAIENTVEIKPLNKVLLSKTYSQLTDYEQAMIAKQIQQKAESIIARSEK